MKPLDFVNFIFSIADRVKFPKTRLSLEEIILVQIRGRKKIHGML